MAAVSDEDAATPSRPFLEVLWRRFVPPALKSCVTGLMYLFHYYRKGDQSPPTRTTFPLSVRPVTLAPAITVRLPPYMTLHSPTLLSYRLSNPTDRLLSLSLQIDSADGFVFAGPRKTPHLVLAPAEERIVPVSVIPLIIGPCVVPRVRVFELLGGDDESGAPRSRELPVVEEADVDEVVDPSQAHLETDLRSARGGEDGSDVGESASRPFAVLVLPP